MNKFVEILHISKNLYCVLKYVESELSVIEWFNIFIEYYSEFNLNLAKLSKLEYP